jgi:hypothetical protein
MTKGQSLTIPLFVPVIQVLVDSTDVLERRSIDSSLEGVEMVVDSSWNNVRCYWGSHFAFRLKLEKRRETRTHF